MWLTRSAWCRPRRTTMPAAPSAAGPSQMAMPPLARQLLPAARRHLSSLSMRLAPAPMALCPAQSPRPAAGKQLCSSDGFVPQRGCPCLCCRCNACMLCQGSHCTQEQSSAACGLQMVLRNHCHWHLQPPAADHAMVGSCCLQSGSCLCRMAAGCYLWRAESHHHDAYRPVCACSAPAPEANGALEERRGSHSAASCSHGGADCSALTSACSESTYQWINYFLHTGRLSINGLRMSKSLKNFITIRCPFTPPRYILRTATQHGVSGIQGVSSMGLVQLHAMEASDVSVLHQRASSGHTLPPAMLEHLLAGKRARRYTVPTAAWQVRSAGSISVADQLF